MYDEAYVEGLFCVQDKLKDKFAEFAEKPRLDASGLSYLDTLMHAAKNLRKEMKAECESEDEGEYSGEYYGNKSGGRAIRTTPDLSGNSSYRGGRSMRGGTSGRRDSRGRYMSDGRSGNNDDIYARIRKMADMTNNHDERQIMLNMIERLKAADQD